MRWMPATVRGCVVLYLLSGAVPASATEASGRFEVDGCVFEPSHVAVLRIDDVEEEMLILTSEPLDVDLAYALDPRQAALEDLTLGGDPARAGLIVTLRDGVPSYVYFCDGTQTSGSQAEAELVLSENTAERLAGTYFLAETTDAMGSVRSWDLRFAAEVGDPVAAAENLPPGGGEPGAAYLRFLADLAEGDVPALRQFVDNPYFFAEGATPEETAQDLAMLRATVPSQVEITGGLADTGGALLDVESTPPDATTESLRILLKATGDGWTFGGIAPAG